MKSTSVFEFHECLFISPDLDGHRAPKMSVCTLNELAGVPDSSLYCSHRTTNGVVFFFISLRYEAS